MSLFLIDKKKNYFNGIMTWQQGLVSGLVLSVLAMILAPFSYIFQIKICQPKLFSNK